jgi:hypothetical protein
MGERVLQRAAARVTCHLLVHLALRRRRRPRSTGLEDGCLQQPNLTRDRCISAARRQILGRLPHFETGRLHLEMLGGAPFARCLAARGR